MVPRENGNVKHEPFIETTFSPLFITGDKHDDFPQEHRNFTTEDFSRNGIEIPLAWTTFIGAAKKKKKSLKKKNRSAVTHGRKTERARGLRGQGRQTPATHEERILVY